MIKGTVYKRKDGRWECRISMGKDENGKRIFRSFYGKSREEAEYKAMILHDYAEKEYALTEMTVKELVTEWVHVMTSRIKESTAANYVMKAEKHLIPAFGSIQCCLLKANDIYSFIERKLKEGLSVRYLSDIIVLFKSIFRYASREYHMLSAITMMFSATVAYFPRFANGNALVAKAEESENLSSDAAENAEESTELIEDATFPLDTIAVLADSEVTDDGWQYYASGDAITISGYSGAETTLVVPESIDGTPVTAIADKAFADNKKLTSVDLGSVKTLGEQIFEGCTGLKVITIPKTVTKTGSSYNGCLEGSSIEKVTFEEGIANIPAYICKNANSVKTVIIPEKEDTLDGYVIETSAFEGTSLTSVTIPESLTALQYYVFKNCALLTEVTIPNNVDYIGISCFEGCKRLKSIDLGTNVGTLGDRVFKNCVGLTSIDLGSVKTLGEQIFEGCTGLKEITIPKTVTKTGSSYNGCLEGSSIEKVTFEEGIANIPAYICKNANSVKTVIIPEKVDTLDGYVIETSAFEGTSLTSVTIPESLTALQYYVFKNCALLTEVTIPDNVDYIGISCFEGCKRLKSIDLGTNVGTLGDRVFKNCVGLTSIDLGSVKTLGEQIFEGCTGIKEITIPKTVTKTGSSYNGCLEGSSIEKVTFEEGIANIPAYICKNASSVKTVIIPEKEDTLDGYVIETSAFEGTSLTSVTIPESLTALQYYVFKNCALLTEVTIPNNVDYIGISCFEGCKRLKSIDLGTNVGTLGDRVFKNCVGLTSIDLGSVKTLGEQVFEGCTGIKEITIPKTVTKTGSSYNGCLEGSSVETVTFEEGIANIPACICKNSSSVKTVIMPEKEDTLDGYVIGVAAFEGTSLTSVTIPESITGIEDYAFKSCALLTDVVIPNNVNYIGNYCFSGCKRLKSIDLGTHIGTLGYKIFEGCTGLKEIIIPKTVTEIKGGYNGGCLEGSSIETLIIASGMKTVPSNIAKNCTSLKTVNLPDTVTTIGNYAFCGCSNLTKVKSNRTTFNFSAKSFEGCSNLDDKRFTVLDRENTYLNSNSEQESVNGIVNYTLKYKLMPSTASSAKDIKLRLNIPAGMTLMLDSVQSKNLSINGNDLSNGVVSVNNSEGEIRFSARITEIGNYEVSADLEFNFNNETWKQLIGKSSVDCPDVTIVAPESVNELSAEVYGLASKGAEVTIYVNDTIAETFTANSKTGKYKGTIKLPGGVDGSEYILRAECGDAESEEITTVYSSVKPVVEKVFMGYNNHADAEMDITDVLKQGVSPVISYNPAYPLTFKITATHSEKIYRMFVTSTKGKATKYMEAFYDSDKDAWIASGYFDPENHSYVPGAINISIIEKALDYIDEDNFDLSSVDILPVPKNVLNNSNVEILEETDHSVFASITVSNGSTSSTYHHYSEQAEGIVINGKYHTKEEIAKSPEKYGYEKVNFTSSSGDNIYSYYVRTIDADDVNKDVAKKVKNLSSDVKDFLSGTSILKKIEGDIADNELMEPLISLGNDYVTDQFKEIIKYKSEELFGYNMYGDITKGISIVGTTAGMIYDMQRAENNPKLQAAVIGMYAIKMFRTLGGEEALMTAANIAPPASIVLGIAINMALDLVGDYLDDCIENNKVFSFSGFIRFIIDPSGIVYEAVIGNPVEGATVTVYFKDPETGESVKWDASDYDQLNPLITDEEGKYLWDVPEGQWKVVCEKEGYETVETDWMDIPPVRTDVNISLVSNAVPELVSADINSGGITVKFSKFVDISTVTSDNLVIADFEGAYTITPQLINEGDKYADTFILSGDFSDTPKTVSITDGITSYAGTSAKKAEINVTDSRISMGDVNGDGTVNLKDAVMIRRYIAGNWDIDINESIADVNGDGAVNLKDVVMIRRYIAGNWDISLDNAV